MPKGQAAISWSAENDVKLFLTVLAVQAVHVDYAAVAKAFGPNVPGSCIQSRMKALRKKANEMGFAASGGTSKRPRASATTTPVKRAKFNNTKKETDDRDSDEDGNLPATPKSSEESASIEGVIKVITPPSSADAKNQVRPKSRVSPRKATKKDYKSLGDPYLAMENTQDSNGERIFEHDKSDSEDSAASDGEFGADAVKAEPVMEI